MEPGISPEGRVSILERGLELCFEWLKVLEYLFLSKINTKLLESENFKKEGNDIDIDNDQCWGLFELQVIELHYHM